MVGGEREPHHCFFHVSYILYDSYRHFLETTYDAPQGLVLGPILFIIYINGLLNLTVSVKIISYADDTVILLSKRSIDPSNIIIKKKLNLD